MGAAANGGVTGASYNRTSAAEGFLYGLHALFKGDLRVGSAADEWVFCDPGILTTGSFIRKLVSEDEIVGGHCL